MITVTLYTRPACEACDQALADLKSLQESVPHRLVVIDLDQNPAFLETYGPRAPVVEAGPYRLRSPFSRQDLLATLGAARDRSTHLESVQDPRFAERIKRGHTLTSADRFSYWLSNHYMLLFNLIVLVYVGVPFLAPVFMETGLQLPAKIIYKVYSPLCHQLAFRSWFLFGEQPAYPREIAQVPGLISYEKATGLSSLDTATARAFTGNPAMGYKVAFCERDIAIYGSVLLFGLIFSLTGRRLRSLPWYVWILVGIIPIAVDGFSQIPSLVNIPWLSWFPLRESTPFLRTLTGFLFGFTTAWFGYPYVEATMGETRQILARKIAVHTQERTE